MIIQHTEACTGQGEIQAIGATTLDEYRKHVEKDPALEQIPAGNGRRAHQGRSRAILFGLRINTKPITKVRITINP